VLQVGFLSADAGGVKGSIHQNSILVNDVHHGAQLAIIAPTVEEADPSNFNIDPEYGTIALQSSFARGHVFFGMCFFF
jgi:hypothetical protein